MEKQIHTWDDFEKFDNITKPYFVSEGEGKTKASQLVIALCKLIYRWFNDGDVYDNSVLEGWCNDISDEGNWIYKNFSEVQPLMEKVHSYLTNDEYTELLYSLAETLLTAENLERLAQEPTKGTIYDCEGPFEFNEYEEEDDDDYEDEEGW
jgi:hypothetical protein